MLTRMLTVVLLCGAAVDPQPESTDAHIVEVGTAPFAVVAVGDSVLTQTLPHLELPSMRIDAEPCRAPYTAGCDDRSSTIDALATAVALSEPDGRVVVQEAGMGDRHGDLVDDEMWRAFVADVAGLVPVDRVIVWVHPASAQSAAAVEQAERRAWIAVDELAGRDVVWVETPTMFADDGLHLTDAGALVLAGEIEAAVGPVCVGISGQTPDGPVGVVEWCIQ